MVHSLHTGHVEKVLSLEQDDVAMDILKVLEDASGITKHENCARTTVYVPIRR